MAYNEQINNDIEKRILDSLKVEKDPNKKYLLIRLYDAYQHTMNIEDKNQSLLQIELSYKKVEKAIKKLYDEVSICCNFVDKDKEINNKNKDISININTINKLRKESLYESIDNDDYGSLTLNNNRFFLIDVFEYYIMLTDCLDNYVDTNKRVKKKIMLLLTKMEILLKLSITYPSQIQYCVDDFIKHDSFQINKGRG